MNATAVARIGAIQATCSFHSIPKLCQASVWPDTLDRRKSLGEHAAASGRLSPAPPAEAAPASLARYHGYTIHVPEITVIHATPAMTHTPTYRRRIRSLIAAGVRNTGRRLHSPARPPRPPPATASIVADGPRCREGWVPGWASPRTGVGRATRGRHGAGRGRGRGRGRRRVPAQPHLAICHSGLGQEDAERGGTAGPVLHPGGAAVQLSEPSDEGEPYAHAR